jgi:hypothetical protein
MTLRIGSLFWVLVDLPATFLKFGAEVKDYPLCSQEDVFGTSLERPGSDLKCTEFIAVD